MAEDRFDVLVIGGGITGVGIALDAAARGFSVALVEKDDFASGTSGRSSRLIHGGFRYLEHREFGLVHEALRERKILLRLAPHLVRPIPMYMLADSLPNRALYRLGLAGYDLLAAGRNVGLHRSVRAEQIREAVPGFGGRSRGFQYFECQTDDARLTIEVARTAQACGAVLANHARVEGLLGGARVEGAAAVDEMTGQRFEIQGQGHGQRWRRLGRPRAGPGRRGQGADCSEQGCPSSVRAGDGPDEGGSWSLPLLRMMGVLFSSSRGRTGFMPGLPIPPIRVIWRIRQ